MHGRPPPGAQLPGKGPALPLVLQPVKTASSGTNIILVHSGLIHFFFVIPPPLIYEIPNSKFRALILAISHRYVTSFLTSPFSTILQEVHSPQRLTS